MLRIFLTLGAVVLAAPAHSQTPSDPYPRPIEATEGVIVVGYSEYAALPDVGGARARPMRLVDEAASGRIFVNDMQGPIYTISDAGEVRLYLDINDPRCTRNSRFRRRLGTERCMPGWIRLTAVRRQTLSQVEDEIPTIPS